MRFSAGIFYDVENLLKGYSFSSRLIGNLSLAHIIEEVQAAHPLEGIAVQRAYANWSDPRLGALRKDVVALGIDPVQVFAFSRDQKKNAADLELAIDAVDLAHVRPFVSTYVIVSGDGGFASLAKKLHEYGKTVIGAAYRNTTSQAFQAVCDVFVPLPDPEQGRQGGVSDDDANGMGSSENSTVTDPRVRRVAGRLARERERAGGAPLDKARLAIRILSAEPVLRRELEAHGFHLSAVREAIQAMLPGFQQSDYGFPKFAELLQHLCAGTELCLRRNGTEPVMLALREGTSAADRLPDLGPRDPHSAPSYRALIATAVPPLRLPEPTVLAQLAEWLAGTRPQATAFDDLAEAACEGQGDDDNRAAVRLGLLAFAAAGAFDDGSGDTALAGRPLSVAPETSAAALQDRLRDHARSIIRGRLDRIDDQVLATLLP